MKKKFEKFLWQLYAWVYDTVLLRLLPYRELQELVGGGLSPEADWRILDAGCGTGNMLVHVVCLRPGVEAVGIDFSVAMLRRARAKIKGDQGVIFQEVDLNHSLPFAGGEFDGVVCVNVLYAVDDPAFLLQEICRVLKKDGRLLVVTPSVQPKMSPIFKEHVRRLRGKAPFLWPIMLVGQAVWTAPLLLVFLMINLFIQRQQSFHFLQGEELCLLVNNCGFTVNSMKKVYGEQCWFLVGEKPGQGASMCS